MDIVIGSHTNRGAVDQLIEETRQLALSEATLYVGYPILSTADESLSLDAILTCAEHGIVVFDFRSATPDHGDDWATIEDHQAELELALKSKLIKYKELTQRRQLAVPIHIVTYVPTHFKGQAPNEDIIVAVRGTLSKTVADLPGFDPSLLRPLNAAIQQVTTIKPRKKRLNVTREDSRGGVLKVIEREIANLDRWQKKAAIECPDGPQRVRGLAGSGKTVVLALKAAYLHAQHPEWNIAVTFQTQSLYGQIRDLIRRFTFEHIQDEPDWDRVRVMHAWGGSSQPGVYSTIAKATGHPSRDFNYGKRRYMAAGAFEGVCKELLDELAKSPAEPIFDALLIDEAQDFGPYFFRLAYSSVKSPKRLIWAYDELQSLKETSIPGLGKLFGTDSSGEPIVKLRNEPDKAQQDIILPVCYRNTPWALSLAHALGFGVYRQDGLIQMFDETGLWQDIGYEVVAGTLTPKSQVTLQRQKDAAPEFFRELLAADDAVQIHAFESDKNQAEWVAEQIEKNIQHDELQPSDIVVIFCDPFTVNSVSGPVVAELRKRGITSHVAGITRSRSEFFVEDSIVISGIYRAKGNEAPMVYVLGAQYCYGGWGAMIRKRNTLFTAITRSRAWVRVCGVGAEMQLLKNEWDKVVQNSFRLTFTVPTSEELQQLRQIHRDRTEDELKRINKSRKSLEEVISLLEREELALDDIPPNLRQKLATFLAEGSEGVLQK